MSEEQEKKWSEEFRIFFFKGSEFWHNSNTAISIEKYSEPYKHGVQGYIEARKKSQEEIDELKEELKRERSVVDFYAKDENWDETMMISDLDIEGFKLGGMDDYEVQAGYFARQTQQQRRIEL